MVKSDKHMERVYYFKKIFKKCNNRLKFYLKLIFINIIEKIDKIKKPQRIKSDCDRTGKKKQEPKT